MFFFCAGGLLIYTPTSKKGSERQTSEIFVVCVKMGL